ncbi:UNVERIFIED_CONTAM: hypothetical protein HHA_452240 [Hammondia hammondi]|eukprot:XP_008885307.1 hypothetical protein HHA_452240 [Hammondia hammondi]
MRASSVLIKRREQQQTKEKKSTKRNEAPSTHTRQKQTKATARDEKGEERKNNVGGADTRGHTRDHLGHRGQERRDSDEPQKRGDDLAREEGNKEGAEEERSCDSEERFEKPEKARRGRGLRTGDARKTTSPGTFRPSS